MKKGEGKLKKSLKQKSNSCLFFMIFLSFMVKGFKESSKSFEP